MYCEDELSIIPELAFEVTLSTRSPRQASKPYPTEFKGKENFDQKS